MGTTAVDRLSLERRALLLIFTLLKHGHGPGSDSRGLTSDEIAEHVGELSDQRLHRRQITLLIEEINGWKYTSPLSGSLELIIPEHKRKDRYRLNDNIPSEVWNELIKECLALLVFKNVEVKKIESAEDKEQQFAMFINLHIAFEQGRKVLVKPKRGRMVTVKPLKLVFQGTWFLHASSSTGRQLKTWKLDEIESIELAPR